MFLLIVLSAVLWLLWISGVLLPLLAAAAVVLAITSIYMGCAYGLFWALEKLDDFIDRNRED